ncbi:hypothetical protein NDU88_000097 [Pleurodeles waltl]|uniref:Uncharacterized protein n=1 Tax=Pleurodeles waltl TaxID=8319 RepID=A0AAV7S8K6_PLEWA|nr:hypothetical protein NDU88_000097 [Pleurodeles waltl]
MPRVRLRCPAICAPRSPLTGTVQPGDLLLVAGGLFRELDTVFRSFLFHRYSDPSLSMPVPLVPICDIPALGKEFRKDQTHRLLQVRSTVHTQPARSRQPRILSDQLQLAVAAIRAERPSPASNPQDGSATPPGCLMQGGSSAQASRGQGSLQPRAQAECGSRK